MLKDKKILVTGASGLIGSSLVDRLLSEGAQVYAMSRSLSKLERVFGSSRDRLHFIQGNVSEGVPDDLSETDIIFHAAGPISGGEIKTHPVDTISSNIDGARNCLEYLKVQKDRTGKNSRIVIFSSATVYGTEHFEETRVSEKDTCLADSLDAPAAAYSEAKRMTEILASAYFRQYAVDAVTARFSYVYGYSKEMPQTAFYEFIKCALDNRDITINAAKMARRDNIYVDDAVSGLVLIAEKGAGGEAYNISSGGEMGGYASASELAEVIAKCADEKFGRGISVRYPNGRCEQMPGVILENSKASELGFAVKTSLSQGIYNILERYITEEKN